MRTALKTLFISIVALINIASTLLPIWPKRYLVLTSIFPVQLVLAAQHVTLFAGVLMLLLANPVARGHRRMSWLLIGCASVAVIMNVVKGLDIEEALLNLALLATLLSTRKQFHDIPMRYTIVDLARIGLALLVIQRAYAFTGGAALTGLWWLKDRLVIWRSVASHPALTALWWLEDRLAVLRSAAHPAWLLQTLTAHVQLEQAFLDEADLALPIFLVGVFVVISWTALAQIERDKDVGDVYRRFGQSARNSLAYIANRGDTLTFIASKAHGAISYKLVGRVALQMGAVLGPTSERAQVYREFREWLKSEGLIAAAVALTPEERAIAEATGMRSIVIGREAMVDLTTFSLERLNKKMRWAQRSLTKRGYRADLLPATQVTGPLRSALARIDEAWRVARGGQSYGCAMTLGRFPNPNDSACLVGMLRDPDGEPVAYLTLLPGGAGAYSLDLTRKLHTAPNAAMEFLLMETLAALKARDAKEVSLNFSTFSGAPAWLGGSALARLGSVAFQTSSLEMFNNKFLPKWTPRYLAVRSWFDLPDVIYAILVVEGADRALFNLVARQVARFRRGPAGAQTSATPAAEQRLSGEGA